MKIVLSPAKRLDEGDHPVAPATTPRFADDTDELLAIMRDLDVPDLKSLMSISENLAVTNFERYQTWEDAATHPAMFLFAGDTYRGLDADSMDPATVDGAQQRVRILSGLYGLLRPLDAMKPYRLEMGTKLSTDRGDTLYEFWDDRIGRALRDELADGEVVVNGASKEYATALRADDLDLPMVDVRFENLRNDNWRVYGMIAKAARGAMARWIAEHDPETVEDLHEFDLRGYELQPDRSTNRRLVFRSRE